MKITANMIAATPSTQPTTGVTQEAETGTEEQFQAQLESAEEDSETLGGTLALQMQQPQLQPRKLQTPATEVTVSPAGQKLEAAAIKQNVPNDQNEIPVSQVEGTESLFDQAMRASSRKSPRQTMIDAVRMQERQSASTNTVDSMTGLQPWSKKWVFKRDDEALNPRPEMGAEEHVALQDLAKKIQGIKAQMRGNEQIDGAQLPGALSVAELDGTEEMSATENGKGSVGTQVRGAPGVRVLDEQAMAKQGMTELGGAEYLGIRNALQSRSAAAQDPAKTSGHLFTDGPVGTWKPGKQPGKNGLLPSQDVAWRDAVAAASTHAGMNQLNHSLSNPGALNPGPREMTAWVTQGAMAQNRLSTEAMVGLGGELRAMTLGGGGEMRIRLRPDHLGELNVRVNTRGNEVSLQIVASDEKARKVIEDSVGYLKESLASQQLTVSRIELTVAPPQANPGNLDQFGQSNQQQSSHQQSLGAEMGQSQSGRQQGNSENGGPGSNRAGLSRSQGSDNVSSAAGARFAQTGRTSSTGRFDVMA